MSGRTAVEAEHDMDRRMAVRGKTDAEVKAEMLAIHAERAARGQDSPRAEELRRLIRGASDQRIRQIRCVMLLAGEIPEPPKARTGRPERRTSKLTPLCAARMPKPKAVVDGRADEVLSHLKREANLWIPGRYVLVSGMEMERRVISSGD